MKRRQHRRGSVQAHYVRVHAIEGDVLVLADTPQPYRAILEVSSTNYTLRSEEEQESIIAGYRDFLKALEFPLQILVRSQPLDLNPYIQRILEPASGQTNATEQRWHELATAHVRFVQQIAQQHTLLEHHFYIVLAASQSESPAAKHPTFMNVPLPRRHRSRQEAPERASLEEALQQLDLRADVVMQRLSALGLYCQRLAGEELVTLYGSCLTPEYAISAPFAHEVLSGIGRPTRRLWPETGRTASISTPISDTTDPQSFPLESFQEEVPYPDVPHLADLLAPASIEVTRDAIRVGEEYARGIVVTTFPREVSAGWLTPLLMYNEVMDLTFHIHPQDSARMLRRLTRRKAEYQSTRRLNQRRGLPEDPELAVAERDVDALITRLASGEERVCEVSLYVLVRAANKRILNQRTERLMGLLRSLFLVAHTATLEHGDAFRSCLPEARNELMRTCTLDSTSLASTFPFVSNSLLMKSGVMIGITPSGEPVMIDEWDESLDNPHEFAGAVTGAGKSYLYKLKIMRELLLHRSEGLHVVVIDPEKEYEQLCRSLYGHYVRLAPGSRQHINPFDLVPQGSDLSAYRADASRRDALAEKVQSLHVLCDLMLAERASKSATALTAKEKGLLDRAIYETYRKAGITADPRTHDRQVPLLQDLYDVLRSGRVGKDETGLHERLERYVHGSLAGLFSAATDVDLNNPLVVFDVRDMSGELRPISVFLITDFVWTQMLHTTPQPRKLYIDEAWSLIQHPEGGAFLATLARRARKRYLSLVTITQSPELFASDPHGKIVATNSAIKVLKRQDRVSAEAVATSFMLTREERQRLLTLGKREALLIVGGKCVLIYIDASPLEHALATTNPRELAQWAAEDQRLLQSDATGSAVWGDQHAADPNDTHRSPR